MGDSENGAARFIGKARNFPAVRVNNLLHDGQTEAGAFLVRREIRFENFRKIFARHAGAVVANFQSRFARARAQNLNLNFSILVERLNRIQNQVKQNLPQ
jgi:hypothetical protein